jgi:hypothetical protein
LREPFSGSRSVTWQSATGTASLSLSPGQRTQDGGHSHFAWRGRGLAGGSGLFVLAVGIPVLVRARGRFYEAFREVED